MVNLPKPFDISLAQSAQDVSFRLQDADPPSPLYIQRDDRIVLQVSSQDIFNQTVTLTVRLLLPGPPGFPIGLTDPKERADYIRRTGTPVVTVQQPMVCNGIITDQTTVLDLAEGYLLSVAVACTGTIKRGLTFVRVWIQRGSSTATPASAALVLLADYVMVNGPLTWPGGRVIGPTENSGCASTLVPPTPAAGADIIFVAISNERVRVQSFTALLTTSAAAGNRTPIIRIRDSNNVVLFESGSNISQAASLVNRYTWASGCSAAQVGANSFLASLPDNCILTLGGNMVTVTGGILAGDQWSVPAVLGEIWLDGM